MYKVIKFSTEKYNNRVGVIRSETEKTVTIDLILSSVGAVQKRLNKKDVTKLEIVTDRETVKTILNGCIDTRCYLNVLDKFFIF